MKTNLPPVLQLLAGIFASVFLIGCSADKVEKRQDSMTNHAVERQHVRQIRTDARQERTDAWYDRAMGKPVKSTSTGLSLPQ